ncbi:MAG: thioesterase [Candidatus Neomarinimicrobiota bacterium]|nr:MAG: thioesterase [Candidatus Neomarinimicrobiota bacterium]
MARVKLILPDNFKFSTQLEVRITDINYGGHLGNDSVLGIIHEARIRLLADKSFTEQDIDGVGIIMADSVILYTSEGLYGDKLRIDVAVDDISNKGCDIYYHIVNISNQKIIVKAKTNIVFYNYTSKKLARTPEIFLNTFK